MVAAFFTFALADPLPPKEMGIVLGLAVLLDAFLIRLALLPVLLRLTGRAAWRAPAWLRRILPDVRFSHDWTTTEDQSRAAKGPAGAPAPRGSSDRPGGRRGLYARWLTTSRADGSPTTSIMDAHGGKAGSGAPAPGNAPSRPFWMRPSTSTLRHRPPQVAAMWGRMHHTRGHLRGRRARLCDRLLGLVAVVCTVVVLTSSPA